MKLSQRFLLLMVGIFCCFMMLTRSFSIRLTDSLNEEWAHAFVKRQVAFDQYRVASPLVREIALARAMANDPDIVHMALDEKGAALKPGLLALEKYRLSFRDHTYFAAFAPSHHYYYGDGHGMSASPSWRYQLTRQPADRWFNSTLAGNQDYQINVAPDAHLGITKLWINAIVRHDGRPIGVVGTGLELAPFLKETVATEPEGMLNLFINRNMAIQLDSDPHLIDYASITKQAKESITVNRFLTDPNDITHLQQDMQTLAHAPDGETRTLWVHVDGAPYLLGLSYIRDLGWYDLTLINPDRFAPTDHRFLALFMFGSGLILALAMMGHALRRWILKPIQLLQASTDRVQHGHFDIQLPISCGGGELDHLSHSFALMVDHVRQINRHLEQKVEERTQELHRLAETDTLTGLLNRRGIIQRFQTLFAVGKPVELGVLLLDIDHFKRINDRLGHGAGDRVLVQVAATLSAYQQPDDHVARWGGEEFLILLPWRSREAVTAYAERLRSSIQTITIRGGSDEGIGMLTASIGACHSLAAQDWESLVHHADDALYQAKSGGRNCVRVIDSVQDILPSASKTHPSSVRNPTSPSHESTSGLTNPAAPPDDERRQH